MQPIAIAIFFRQIGKWLKVPSFVSAKSDAVATADLGVMCKKILVNSIIFDYTPINI